MKPLTIEELKSLEAGDWVWIILLDKMFRLKVETEDVGEGYYQKYNNRRKDAYVTFHLNFYYKDYGTKWLAYKNKEQAECKEES